MKTIKMTFKNILSLGIILLILSIGQTLQASKSDTLSIMKLKKYEQTKKRAEKFYDDFAYLKGIDIYKKVLKMVPSDDTVKLEIASGYFQINSIDSAGYWYNKVINSDSVEIESIHYLQYAEVLISQGKYQKSKYWFERFEEENPDDIRVGDRLAGLDKIISFYADSIKFEVWHETFNSDTYDFSPSYIGDDILFVSARETSGPVQFLKPKYKLDKTYFLNLFTVDSEGHAQSFDKRIKSSYHEGPVAFYDNETKVIFTRNNFKKSELRLNKSKLHLQGAVAQESNEGINKLKLFYSEKIGKDKWSTPVELWFNDDQFSTGHPTVSEDNQTLYFASDRPGGYGKADIYKSIWRNGVWSEPENMGGTINSEGSELFPYLEKSNMLYFASDGHQGLGGLDIFQINLNDIASKPENMGYPLNSSTDDFGLIIKEEEVKYSGYFSSNRAGGLGLDDIYGFSFEKGRDLPGKVIDLWTGQPVDSAQVSVINHHGDTTGTITTGAGGHFIFRYEWEDSYLAKAGKPTFTTDTLSFDPADYPHGDTLILRIMKEVLVIQGTMTDKIKGDTLEAVKIMVTNESTKERFGMITKTDGAYSFIGKTNTTYSFVMKKHRYFTETSSVSTGTKTAGTIIHDGQLEEIIIGKPIALNNIQFDLAKWNIRPDAATELDKFVKQLNETPSIIVELSAHTDCRGSDAYNLNLSDQRAKSSAKYAIDNGIPKERLVGKGYGETKLLNHCDDGVRCSAAEHQINRRTEFMVTGFLPETTSEDEEGMLWIDPNYLSANMTAEHKKNIVGVSDGSKGKVTLSGKVVNQAGEPVANALISVMAEGEQKAIQVYTDDQGIFTLKAEANKNYRIVAQQSDYIEEGIKVSVSASSQTNLSFELTKKN